MTSFTVTGHGHIRRQKRLEGGRKRWEAVDSSCTQKEPAQVDEEGGAGENASEGERIGGE